MTPTSTTVADDSWDDFWGEWEQLRTEVRRSKAVNVNAAGLRSRTQSLVQNYFRQVRPALASSLGESDLLMDMDRELQTLLRLAQGRNARSSYVRTLGGIGSCRASLAVAREQALSRLESTRSAETSTTLTASESRLVDTLTAMLPAAAMSYQQALLLTRTWQRHRASNLNESGLRQQ
jgi:hypothetical protein